MRIESLPHVLPALNRGKAFFGIGIGAPVRGLRQVRASQTLTENVPNPRSSIRLPQANVAAISSSIDNFLDFAKVADSVAVCAIQDRTLIRGTLAKAPRLSLALGRLGAAVAPPTSGRPAIQAQATRQRLMPQMGSRAWGSFDGELVAQLLFAPLTPNPGAKQQTKCRIGKLQ